MVQFGVRKKRFASGLLAHWCDRPRFEDWLRQRVTALANVRLIAAHQVSSLMSGTAALRSWGCGLLRREAIVEELRADFVVDASGSGSRAPRWLEDLGYGRVCENQIDVGYATRIYRRLRRPSYDPPVLVIYPRQPESRRVGVLIRWMTSGASRR